MEKIPIIKFKSNLEKNGFEIKPLSELLAMELPKDHDPFLSHIIEFFAIIIITADEGFHFVDFREYKLSKNECLLISKGQAHAFSPKTKYEGYIILFTEDFSINKLSKNSIKSITRLYNYHINPLHYLLSIQSFTLIDLIFQEQANGEIFLKYDIIASLLVTWFGKLEQSNHHKQTKINVEDGKFLLFDAFKNHVEKNYQTSRDAKYYADILHVSYKHLNDIVKKYTNKTAKEFIDDFVILEAKRFLCSTSLSVKEIAFKCGFDEQTNFQKYFKKLAKDTPSNFRQRLRG